MKWLQTLSIRSLILLLLMLMTIPAVGIIIHAGLQDRNDSLKDAAKEAAILLSSIATRLETEVDSSQQMMETLSLLPEVRQKDSAATNRILADLHRKYPIYANIIMVDRTGVSWASAVPFAKPISLAERKAFKDAMETGRFATGEYVVGKTAQKPVMNFALPLKDHNGALIGAILFGINLEHIGRLINSERLPAGTSFGIFDHQGTFLYRTMDNQRFIGKKDRPQSFAQMKNGPDEGVIDLISNDGIHRLSAYRKIRLSQDQSPYAYVRGGMPIASSIKKANIALFKNLTIMSISLLLTFALSLLICRRLIVNRIALLNTASQLLANGDYNSKVSDHIIGGELGRLAESFDSMANKLIQRDNELAKSQRFLNMIIDTEPECIKLLDRDGNLLLMNRAGLEMIQADSYEQVDGQCVYQMVTEPYRADFIALTNRVFQGIPGKLEFETVGLKGGHIWLGTHAVPFRDEQGEITALLGITRDITERIKSEMELRESKSLLTEIIELSPISMAIVNMNGTIEHINRRAIETFGYSPDDIPNMDRWWVQAYPDESYRAEVMAHWMGLVEKAIVEKTEIERCEYMVTCKDGTVKTALIFGILVSDKIFVIFDDITDRKIAEEERLTLERQLLQSQKMESLGVLAGGIAHDFNNILTAIVGNTELALMRLKPESPILENLQRIEKGAVRATDLAKQMLAYSGKGKFVVESIDLNHLVEEMGHMLDVSISKKAVLRFNLTKPLPSIEADATQIRQVIMNLVINASEAIGEKSGVIAITTGCINCDRNYLEHAWVNRDIPEGLYVFLEVADTGCGMDKETQSKLFDPFFTTKFTGRGLGMAAVQGIVRGHKGAINVYSEVGKGSSFKLLFPAGAKPIEQFDSEPEGIVFRGEGTILLVDDEETVRAIGTEMLKELGFTVITANDGRDAVEIYKSHEGLLCVILDLTMPHMDGEQTFRELRMIDPDVKVIMSSGYSEYEVTQKFAGKGLSGFIQKPYKMSAFQDVLQRI